jgi:CBS domain-containing protein
MVTDEMHQLVGVITMFDILYHLRPTFLNYGVDGYAVSWEKLMEPAINELKDKHVRQIMSRDVVTADPDDHVMAVLDRMVKHKYRRLPVVKNGRLVGVVYIADVFYHLFNR